MTARMAPQSPGIAGNRLLAVLSPGELEALWPHVDRVALPQGRTLHKAQTAIDHVYFPESGIVSLVKAMKDGTTIEVGQAGREGMIGAMLLLGADTTALEAIVQMPGAAWRLPASLMLDVMARNPAFKTAINNCARSLLMQIYQSAACHARHTLEQRLAKWLLMVRDRTDADELPVKHEFIALLLGTRRPSVSVAIAGFKAKHLVGTRHSCIVVLDRPGLEGAACECYRTLIEQGREFLAEQ